MPKRFFRQIVVAVLALVALGSDAAWADKFPRGVPQRSVPQRYAPQTNEPPRSQPQRMEPPRIDLQRNENAPQRIDPRDSGLPASVRRVQRETGGQVLRAQPFERDGREVYRVKVLTPQGRIRVVEDMPPPPPGYAPPSNPPMGRRPE